MKFSLIPCHQQAASELHHTTDPACLKSNKSCFITPLNWVNRVRKLCRRTSRMSKGEVYFSEALTWVLETINLNDFPPSTSSQFVLSLDFSPSKRYVSFQSLSEVKLSILHVWRQIKHALNNSQESWAVVIGTSVLKHCWTPEVGLSHSSLVQMPLKLIAIHVDFQLCWNSGVLCAGDVPLRTNVQMSRRFKELYCHQGAFFLYTWNL